MNAPSAWRIGLIEMRNHLAGASATTYPAKIVAGIFGIETEIGCERAEAAGRDASRYAALPA